MAMKTCFVVCEGLRRELETVLAQLRALPGADGLGQLAAATYPGCCRLAPGAPARLDVGRWLEGARGARLHVFGGGCLCGRPLEIAGPPGCQLHEPETCAQMLVGQELAGWLTRRGARLLAPGCLAAWRAYLAAWGPDQAQAFFASSAPSFVLLDTGVDPAAEAALDEFAAFVGRPCEPFPAGLGPLQATIQAILLRDQLAHAAEMRAEVAGAEAALRESENRYHALFDTTLSGMVLHEVICDAGGVPLDFRILDANPAFERLTGLRRAGVIGKTVRETRPAVDPGLIERYCRVALTGVPEHFEGVFETQGRSYEAVAFSPRRGQFAVCFSDVTERKRAEAEQLRLARALRILSQCNQALVHAGSQEALLAEVCRIIVQDGRYRLAWVALAEDDTSELRVVAQAGPAAGAGPAGDEESGLTELLRHLGAGALGRGEPIIRRGPGSQAGRAHRPQPEGADGPAALAALPLTSGGRRLGVLGIISGEAGAFDETERPLLAELAGDLAFGIVTLSALAGRDQAEAVLRESEARYRSLVELSPSAIHIQVDGKIAYVNAAGLALFGASRPEELGGRDYLELVCPEERENARERLAQVEHENVPVPLVERKLRRLDGGQAVALVAANPTTYRGRRAIHVVALDISRQRRAEEALIRTEALVRRVVEESSDGIFVTDAAGRIVEWNPALAELTGLPIAMAKGRFIWDVYSQLAPRALWNSSIYRDLRALFEGTPPEAAAGPSRLVDIAIQRPDGSRHIVQTAAYPISTGEGRLLACIGRDVTALKQQEEASLQKQKMESIGMLAGGIAHDFNNLLTGVLAQTSLAASTLEAGHPARAHLAKAIKSTQRAGDLTRQLLAYAGRGQTCVVETDLNALVRDNLELLETAIPRTAELCLELAEGLPIVKADRAQLQQVVMNLVINAAEALEEGAGRITVRTSPHTVLPGEEGRRFVTTAVPPPGSYVCLQVADTGRGMDESVRAHIFDPFFSTKGTGRGLGLAAMLGIVRSHGGGLSVASVPGQGSTFAVFFPAPNAGPGGPAEAGQAVPSVASATDGPAELPDDDTGPSQGEPGRAGELPLVLVIDDEEPVREALSDILAMAGYRVITAGDGQAGLAAYLEHRGEVRVVLLDLLMPVVGGEETLRRLRLADPGARVILSSGFDEQEAGRRFRTQSVAEMPDDFIAKPYSVAALVSKVSKLAKRQGR
jgi:PAS domain S-box-containing protein